MELTQEQLDTIIDAAIKKALNNFSSTFVERLNRDVINKSQLDEFKAQATEHLEKLRKEMGIEIGKTNEAVNKIATETETRIKKLETVPVQKSSQWFMFD